MFKPHKHLLAVIATTLVVGLTTGYALRIAHADGIPDADVLTYAGTLEDAAGAPLSGSKEIQVNVYADGTSPTVACQSLKTPQNVVAGRFEVKMPADCVTAMRINRNAHVEVIVDTKSLGRSRVGAVPFAVEAGAASEAKGSLALRTVPSGAVMAFDLDACPAGWTTLDAARGRTIVGVNSAAQPGLSQRVRGQTAGEESHVMTTPEMPSHDHVVGIFNVADPFQNNQAGLVVTGGTLTASTFGGARSEKSGGGAAFNVMQPSLVLLYCKKN